MEIKKSLNLTRKELSDLLKGIAEQLEAGGPVKSETLNAEVTPGEPISVKFEYEEEYGQKKMEIDIDLIG